MEITGKARSLKNLMNHADSSFMLWRIGVKQRQKGLIE